MLQSSIIKVDENISSEENNLKLQYLDE